MKDEYKIEVPIISNQELTDFDSMLNNLEEFENMFTKISKHIYKDRELILLQKVIEKQQRDIEDLKDENNELREQLLEYMQEGDDKYE